MPTKTAHRSKARSMDLMMKNPQLRRMIKDAWDAPIGSSRRESAKHVVSIMTKLHGVQNDPGVAHMEDNPWAHLPPHRPILNYAMHAPTPQREKTPDGKGGPGPAYTPPTNPLSGSIFGPMLPGSTTAQVPPPTYGPSKPAPAPIFGPSAPAPSGLIPKAVSGVFDWGKGLLGGAQTPTKLATALSPGVLPRTIGTAIAQKVAPATKPLVGSVRELASVENAVLSSLPQMAAYPFQAAYAKAKAAAPSLANALWWGYEKNKPAPAPDLSKLPAAQALKEKSATITRGMNAMFPGVQQGVSTAKKGPVLGPPKPTPEPPKTGQTSFYSKPEDVASAPTKIGAILGTIPAEDGTMVSGSDYASYIKTMTDQMFQSGQDWGTVWNQARQSFPDSVSDTDIDTLLDTKWKNAGAYESYAAGVPAGQVAGAEVPTQGQDSQFAFPGISAGITASSASSGYDPSSMGMTGGVSSALDVPSTAPTGATGYTGSTGVLGRYDLNSIPGLDINAPENAGLTTTEYEMKALNTISQMDDAKWSEAFPGIPKPQGASLAGQIDGLIEMKKKDLGLNELIDKRTKMLDENPLFVQDAREYIVEHDQQMKQIDSMLDDVKSMPMPDDPTARGLLTSYQNYLNVMKGKTAQRYSTYLNRAVDVRNQEAARLDTEISNAQQELQMAIPSIQAKATEDYSRILKIIDENAQKPALAAQMASQAAKDQRDNLKTSLDLLKTQIEIGKLGSSSGDDFSKQVKEVIGDVQDPTTKGWRLSSGNIVDYATTYGKDPNVVIAAMKQVMPASIYSVAADKITNKKPAGGLTSTLDELQSYEVSIKNLNDSLNARIAQLQQNNPSDPQIGVLMGQQGKLVDVQYEMSKASSQLFGSEIGGAWRALEPDLKALAGKPGGWFGIGKVSPTQLDATEKPKWVSTVAAKTGLDVPFLNMIFDYVALNTQAFGPTYPTTLTSSKLTNGLVSYYEALVSGNAPLSLYTDFTPGEERLQLPGQTASASPPTGF